MKNVPYVSLVLALMCFVLAFWSCGPNCPPSVTVEADAILIGFEDQSAIELSKGTSKFKEISDEAIAILQSPFVAAEEVASPDNLEKVKRDNKFVEIGFAEPVEVPISRHIDKEDRDRYLTTEEGCRVLELTSAVFVFTGEYDGLLFEEENYAKDWYVWDSKRSFGKLEKLVDAAAREGLGLPASGPTFELAADLPSVDSMTVYRFKDPVVTTEYVKEIGSRLGFADNVSFQCSETSVAITDRGVDRVKQLKVWVNTGAIKYQVVEPDIVYPSYPPSLPTAEEARGIAYEFLLEADLLPDGYIEDGIEAWPQVDYPFHEEDGYTPYIVVNFPRQIEGLPVLERVGGSGGLLRVYICDHGEVGMVSKFWRRIEPYEEVVVKPAEEAYQELVAGKGSWYVHLACETVVVEQVSPAYRMGKPSMGQDYVLPAYQFKGKCLNENGEYMEDFYGWCEAIQ